jgi:hypothetical protein
VSTTEELLGRNSSDFGLENREYGGRSVVIVRLGTKATEFVVAVFVRLFRAEHFFFPVWRLIGFLAFYFSETCFDQIYFSMR